MNKRLLSKLEQGEGTTLMGKLFLTRRQRQVLFLYYNENYTMAEIGAQLGVDRTTVSRTLKRGEQRLLRCLRYGGAALLRESFGEDGAENLRPPVDKRRSGVR